MNVRQWFTSSIPKWFTKPNYTARNYLKIHWYNLYSSRLSIILCNIFSKLYGWIFYILLLKNNVFVQLDLPNKAGVYSKSQPESKCPELLANYCDMLLRKTPLSKVNWRLEGNIFCHFECLLGWLGGGTVCPGLVIKKRGRFGKIEKDLR